MHLIPEKNVALLIPFFPLPVDPRVLGCQPATAPHTFSRPVSQYKRPQWLPKLSISIMYPGYKLAVITHILNVLFSSKSWFEVKWRSLKISISRNCEAGNKITTSRQKPLAAIVCKVILDPVFCNVIIGTRWDTMKNNGMPFVNE